MMVVSVCVLESELENVVKILWSCNSGEVVKCHKSLIVRKIKQKLKAEFHVLFDVNCLKWFCRRSELSISG